MIVTYNWLKEWIDFDLTWDSLPSVLRSLGIGVDKVEKKDNDIVYDLEITPNRPDLLGVLGIAREISAYTGNPLKKRISEYSFKGEPKLEVDIEDSADCARYILASIDGIEIKESPEWIKRKLEFAGLRSVNNIVDISNYVMLELGHPLHIFDKTHIDRIIVRRGRRGESILTLDGNEVALDEDILLICNSKEPIAIAGIIGGEHSGVKE
ncbi:MAG TPA: phenylalanine--tRNA ligase subunit beta, partial [candidate division WOR-3 bacterium]|nr:phenylalanine--tRNA ligase subunit beta [candidate division WOR-3 bacterium]